MRSTTRYFQGPPQLLVSYLQLVPIQPPPASKPDVRSLTAVKTCLVYVGRKVALSESAHPVYHLVYPLVIGRPWRFFYLYGVFDRWSRSSLACVRTTACSARVSFQATITKTRWTAH